jgi:hypothetical protein
LKDNFDAIDQSIEVAFGGFAQQGFKFGEEVFDGVEVGRIGRHKDDLGAVVCDGFAHPGYFMATESSLKNKSTCFRLME